MTDRTDELLESIDSKLDRIIAYTRFQAFSQIKDILPKLLDTSEKRIVYQACDGKSGINDIARSTGINPMNISNWIKKFESQGIVYSYLYKNKKCPLKIIDLGDIGLATPKLIKSNNEGEQNGEFIETTDKSK